MSKLNDKYVLLHHGRLNCGRRMVIKKHESRKIFVEFRESRSLVFSEVVCVLQTRFVLESL